jgi:hypothetical protein
MRVKTADGDTHTNNRAPTLCSATPALCINAEPFYFFCQKKSFENFGGTLLNLRKQNVKNLCKIRHTVKRFVTLAAIESDIIYKLNCIQYYFSTV